MSLSRRTPVTVSGTNPAHGRARAPSPCSSSARNESFHPSLERRDPQRPLQSAARSAGQVEQPVDIGDRQSLRSAQHSLDRVAGLHAALLQHPEVEARAVVGDEQRRHPRLLHPQPEAEAGHPRLGDLEDRLADPVAIADADLVVGAAPRR